MMILPEGDYDSAPCHVLWDHAAAARLHDRMKNFSPRDFGGGDEYGLRAITDFQQRWLLSHSWQALDATLTRSKLPALAFDRGETRSNTLTGSILTARIRRRPRLLPIGLSMIDVRQMSRRSAFGSNGGLRRRLSAAKSRASVLCQRTSVAMKRARVEHGTTPLASPFVGHGGHRFGISLRT